jgi:hypothetical protein
MKRREDGLVPESPSNDFINIFNTRGLTVQDRDKEVSPGHLRDLEIMSTVAVCVVKETMLTICPCVRMLGGGMFGGGSWM